MRLRILLLGALSLLVSTSAFAQSLTDPDDFLDPRQHHGPVFIARAIAGAALNPSDEYRELHQNIGFVALTGAFYWKHLQFDYKHVEEGGADHNDPIVLTKCGCQPPIYFPTAPPPGAMPLAPLPGSKDTFQFALYHPVPGRAAEPPVMLRFRGTVMRRTIGTEIISPTGQPLSRLSGREQSFGLDADTYFRLGPHDVFGSLAFARLTQSGTTANRNQSELTYTSRPPAIAAGKVLIRSMLAVGIVFNRGVGGINLVNPMIEAFFHDWKTRANFHLIYSPQATRSRLDGWSINSQIAFYIDRALFILPRR